MSVIVESTHSGDISQLLTETVDVSMQAMMLVSALLHDPAAASLNDATKAAFNDLGKALAEAKDLYALVVAFKKAHAPDCNCGKGHHRPRVIVAEVAPDSGKAN